MRAEHIVGIVTFDMHAAARAHTPDFDNLPPVVQEGIVRKVIEIVEAGAGLMLEPPCTCTVGEYMAGHKPDCTDRVDNRCTSVSPPPFGFQCAEGTGHEGFHVDDTGMVSWEAGPWA